MRVLLKFRQGSFLREVPSDLEEFAIVRAGELMDTNSGCMDFEITDAHGRQLKSGAQIMMAYKILLEECHGPATHH
jgi:hypothetical protein